VFLVGAIFAVIIVHKIVLPSLLNGDPSGKLSFGWHWLFTFFIGASVYHLFLIYKDFHDMSQPGNHWGDDFKGWYDTGAERAIRWLSVFALISLVAGELPIVELRNWLENGQKVDGFYARLDEAFRAAPADVRAAGAVVEEAKHALREILDYVAGDGWRSNQFVWGCAALFFLMVIWGLLAGFKAKAWKGWYLACDGLALAFWIAYLRKFFEPFVISVTLVYVFLMVLRWIRQPTGKKLVFVAGVLLLAVNLYLEPALRGR